MGKKLKVAEYARHHDIRCTAKRFGIPSSNVDRWLKEDIDKSTKSEKQRITAVLSCTSSGKMLPPMVIFKGKTQRVIKDISNSHGAVVSFQKEAWMDEIQMIKWTDDVWIKYTKKRCSLLILDSCTAHI